MDTLLTLAIAFIAGIVFYYIDLSRGRRWNTRWYDLTHQHKSPSLLDKGLIHLQPFQQKLLMAIIIAGLFTAVAIAVGGAHALLDLISGAIAVVGLMLGFYASVFLFKGKQLNMEPMRKAMNKVDELEQKVHDTGATPTPHVAEPVKRASSGSEKEEAKPQEEKPDWRAGIKKFTDK